MWTVPLIVLFHKLQMDFTKSKVLSVFSNLFIDVLFLFLRFPQYFNKKTEFTMIFFVTGCGNAQNMGTESTISGLSGSCVSFLCSAGRSLGLPSSKQTPRCVLCRVSHGVCWDMIRRSCAGNELMLSWPWMQNYQSAFPASVGYLQRAQNWEHRLYYLWLKNNICVLFW